MPSIKGKTFKTTKGRIFTILSQSKTVYFSQTQDGEFVSISKNTFKLLLQIGKYQPISVVSTIDSNEVLGPFCNCGERSVQRNAGFTSITPYWYCPKCKKEANELVSEDKSNFWDDEYGSFYYSKSTLI